MISGSGSMRGIIVAAVLGLGASGLGGCAGGFDGVEFNGKVFDAMGLSGDPFKKPEVRTEARAPLVLPPDADRLPEPGTAPQPAVANAAWPKDAQARKVTDAEARKRAQQAHCDNNWRQKAVKDEVAADHGPEGSCTGSIFGAIGKTLFGGGDE